MATTAYLAGTDSNDLELSYAPEATWGTSPVGSGAYQKFRVNGEGFSEQKNRSRPGEIRADWQVSAAVTQDLQASGNLQFGISYRNTDDLLAGLVTGAWTTDLAISTVGIAAAQTLTDGSQGTFTGVASDFDDAVVGQWIKVAGFSTEGANGYYRVISKLTDGSAITVAPSPAADAGGTSETITITGSMLRNAKVFNSFSIQKRLSTGLGFIYPGTFFTGGQINAARGQFFSGTLDALCKNETKAAAEVGSNAVAALTNKVMNTVGHFQALNIDGTASTSKIMSLNTTITREGAALAFALGSEAAQGIGSVGGLSVGVSAEIYFADYDLYDAYKAETEKEFSYRVTDTAGNTYIITIPIVVLGTSTITIGGPNQAVMARFDGMADPSSTYNCTIQIDRMAA
jgi:hypothetical protein